MPYEFRRLDRGPTFHTLRDGFTRRAQCEAYARDYFKREGYVIMTLAHDDAHDGVDIMTAKHGELFQFAIDITRADG